MRGAETADAVVVGGGTVGGWCAWFLRRAGLERIALVERAQLGRGASSRAAGMVRAQGGTSWAVRPGMWSQEFYRAQREQIGVDSGFTAQGYLMPAFTESASSCAVSGRRRSTSPRTTCRSSGLRSTRTVRQSQGSLSRPQAVTG